MKLPTPVMEVGQVPFLGRSASIFLSESYLRPNAVQLHFRCPHFRKRRIRLGFLPPPEYIRRKTRYSRYTGTATPRGPAAVLSTTRPKSAIEHQYRLPAVPGTVDVSTYTMNPIRIKVLIP
jgi:hypothetical protein